MSKYRIIATPIGQDNITVPFTAEEEAAEAVAEAAAAAQAPITAIYDEITRLETLETPRRMAEAVMLTALTNDPVYPAATNGKLWLEANRAAIATKRATL